MRMGNFFDRFCLNFLRGNDLNKADFKVFKLSGLIFLQAILVGIVFVPLHYKAGGFKLILYSLIVSGAGVISLLLFRYTRHRNFSKLLFITICNLAIYYNAIAVGMQGGLQFFFGVTLSLPFFMFTNAKNQKSIIYSLLLPVVLGIFLVIVPFKLAHQVSIDKYYADIYFMISSISTLLMLVFSSYYFHLTIESNEKNIEAKDILLFQAEKMVSLGVLASGIAHEINNPLTVIKLSLISLRRSIEDGTIDDDKTDNLMVKVNKISLMTDRIAIIVRALKTYMRNGVDDPLTSLNIGLIFHESFIMIEDEIKTKEITLNINIDKDIEILGREGQLIQIFTNLIKNSIDAVKNNDEKWIKITSVIQKNNIIISFLDSGLGIPKHSQDNLFTPFYTTKEVGEGTGLGLYISKNLSEAMQGSLEYDSNSPNTLFKLSLQLS